MEESAQPPQPLAAEGPLLLHLARKSPFEDSVEVLKKATEVDHLIKSGDTSLVGRALRLYTFGLLLLEEVLSGGGYSTQVVTALQNKCVSKESAAPAP